MKKTTLLIVTMLLSCLLLLGSGAFLTTVSAETTKENATEYLYTLPYAAGEKYFVSLAYNDWVTHVGLYAIDWLMPEKTPVLAIREGKVIKAVGSFSETGMTPDFYQKANTVVIQHPDGSFAEYMHFSKNGVLVKIGQQVKTGEKIGLSGNTGFSSDPHLHLMVFRENAGKRESFPILFKSGMTKPYEIFRGCWYYAPGTNFTPNYDPFEEAFPGELAKIKFKLREIVKSQKNSIAAATAFTAHLKENHSRYHQMYQDIYSRSQKGDAEALTLLVAFAETLDIQTDPDIARLFDDPSSAPIAQEGLELWQLLQVIEY
ncbi:MAG: M23 family metallopeptidase [Candidatus Riflebacteria bacterium]|nr:M23 family metallopeptidase [Candidatus Riflebacteria bacterium]